MLAIAAPALSLVVMIALIVFAKRLHALTMLLGANTSRMENTINRMEAATFVVRDNLAESVARADAIRGLPGEAADAHLRSAESMTSLSNRQLDSASDLRDELKDRRQ